MRVAVLGAGAGGAASAVELGAAGHEVRLWARGAGTLAPFVAAGGVGFSGVLGEGVARLAWMGTELGVAIEGAEVAVVALPVYAHAGVAGALREAGWGGERPVVLNPGHTGGVLEFVRAYGGGAPPVAEFSTLTYVARKNVADRVTVTGRAGQVRVAALPGGEAAIEVASALFGAAREVGDVLASGLANVNMVLHPPGAVLGAAWVEATGGDFTFYVQGMTPGVGRVLEALDRERCAVARAFGHDLPDLVGEMQLIGTMPADARALGGAAAAVAAGEANRRIMAPDRLGHRYYREDLGWGLAPFLVFADIAGVAVPVAASLLVLGREASGFGGGRAAAAMGIEGLDREGLLRLVRG